MTRLKVLTAAGLIAGTALAPLAIAQETPPAPPAVAAPAAADPAVTPIDRLATRDGLTIAGRVADIFGNKFILEDSTGRVLVETGPAWFHQIELREGEEVRVTGEPDDGSFDAFSITRADGTRTEIRPADGPPPWAGGRERAGRGGPEREAALGGPRRSEERGPREVSAADELPQAEIVARLEAAGYTDIDDIERKGRHFEIDAQNRFGEDVEVHVDFGGAIYREKRD